MEKIMRNFQNWLQDRDDFLCETLSKEKMMQHGMDALKAANDEKRQEDELEEKVRAIKYLAGIKKKIEKWVDAHNKGAKALKLIAAALLNSTRGKNGIKSSVRKIYNHELKSLKDMQDVFTHKNLMQHMTDLESLQALYMVLNTNFGDHIMGLENDPMHQKVDHEHGEIGRAHV